MAYLFSDENFPDRAVEHLRELGHVVLTMQEAGKASTGVPDSEVLALAVNNEAALLTLNRRHFIRLHQLDPNHKGIIVCTFNPDFDDLAERIDTVLATIRTLEGKLVRVTRG